MHEWLMIFPFPRACVSVGTTRSVSGVFASDALGHRIDWHAVGQKALDELQVSLFGRLDHAPPEIGVAARAERVGSVRQCFETQWRVPMSHIGAEISNARCKMKDEHCYM